LLVQSSEWVVREWKSHRGWKKLWLVWEGSGAACDGRRIVMWWIRPVSATWWQKMLKHPFWDCKKVMKQAGW
jgi:hypothetical protein